MQRRKKSDQQKENMMGGDRDNSEDKISDIRRPQTSQGLRKSKNHLSNEENLNLSKGKQKLVKQMMPGEQHRKNNNNMSVLERDRSANLLPNSNSII